MARQSRGQKATVERVMHEFKHGELEAGGRRIRNRKQAVAVALSEAGESRNQTSAENKRRLQRTKRKERHGETARDMKEGRGNTTNTRKSNPSRRRTGTTRTRAELYAEARRRDVPGRSRMNKSQLEQALKR